MKLKPDNTNATGKAAMQVPRTDVGRAARAERRRASRDPRVLQADQCGEPSVSDREWGRAMASSVRRRRSLLPDRRLSSAGAARRSSAGAGRHDGVLQGARSRGGGEVQDAVPLFRGRASHVRRRQRAARSRARRTPSSDGPTRSLAPLDTLIAANPHEETYRTVQLRTLESLGRDAQLRRGVRQVGARSADESDAVSRVRAHAARRKTARPRRTASSLRARQTLGTTKDLQFEIAQARAAQGQWIESARSVAAGAALPRTISSRRRRTRLRRRRPSSRAQIREIFLAPPIEVPVATRARRSRDDVGLARRRLERAARIFRPTAPPPTRGPNSRSAPRPRSGGRSRAKRSSRRFAWGARRMLAIRAATAAMNSGDAGRRASSRAAVGCRRRLGEDRAHLSPAARARARGARASRGSGEARRAVRSLSRHRARTTRSSRTIAWGWVRTGDMNRARAALATTGAEGDSSDAAGWLALYEGNLKTARALLRGGTESSPELALALGVVARLKVRLAPADRQGISGARARRQRGRRAASSSKPPSRRTPHGSIAAAPDRRANRRVTWQRRPAPSRSGSASSRRRKTRPRRRRPSSSGRSSCAARAMPPVRRRISST